jgi:hypothetical protein
MRIWLWRLVAAGMVVGAVPEALAQNKKDEKRLRQIQSEPHIVLDDTLYVKGKPYALFLKVRQGLGLNDYSLRTLGGKELAYARCVRVGNDPQTADFYYEVTFMGSGAKCEIRNNPLQFAKAYAKEIVGSDLVVGADINPEGERRFLLIHSQKVGEDVRRDVELQTLKPQAGTAGATPAAGTAVRGGIGDPSKPVYAVGSTVKQGNVLLANIRKQSVPGQGRITEIIDFTNPGGLRLAQAEFAGVGSTTATILTYNDNRRHTLTVTGPNRAQAIAEFLLQNGYL